MRILIFGDEPGVSQLLRHVPDEHVVGIVGAGIRSQYHESLRQIAAKLRVPFIIQPKWQSAEYRAFFDAVSRLDVDLIWINSYSMILRDDVLAAPRLGAINIHGALLPRNRGSNPIQWAIINGDTETGVSLHEVVAEVDAGPIIDQQAVPIRFEDSWITVKDRLAVATEDLIVRNMAEILSGTWSSRAQDPRTATQGKRRTPTDGAFSWSEPTISIYNKIRALLPPLPPAFYLDADGKRHEMATHISLQRVTELKYGTRGRHRLESAQVRMLPRGVSTGGKSRLPEETRGQPALETGSRDAPESGSESVTFDIEDRKSGQSIASVELSTFEWDQRSVELHFRIDETATRDWRRYVDVIGLTATFAFADLKMSRVYSLLEEGDTRSVAILNACGFRAEHSAIPDADEERHRPNIIEMSLRNPDE